MTRPAWEVADVIRRSGSQLLERYQGSLSWAQLKVLNAIARCRTAALGGHRDQCLRCGYQAISYNSCRNRHCPKCQTNARQKWLRRRQQELLPVDYNQRRTMTLTSEEFLRRFLQHVLPKGFPRIRYFGWLANRRRGQLLPLCRLRLAQQPPPEPIAPADNPLWPCPRCHGPMVVVERLTATQVLYLECRKVSIHDSS